MKTKTITKCEISYILLRIIILMIGLTIAHLGVTLFILTNLGSDPYNVFVQGLYRTLQNSLGLKYLTHGYTHILISFLAIVIIFIVNKSYIRIGTILCMVFGGPIIDIFTLLFKDYINDSLTTIVRVPILIAGCVILAFGMTIVIKSEAGTGPNDLIAIVISDRIHKKFSIIRILVDVSFVTMGWLIGGVFGVGTIICAFMVGPVAGAFMPVSEKIVKSILQLIDRENKSFILLKNTKLGK